MIPRQHFPFQFIGSDGSYAIHAPIEDDELFDKYFPFFESQGYEANGYCWEGHIIQILEKEDPELLEHIEFDSEAGSFYAYADSSEARERFVKLLSPIFSDLDKLQYYVENADRDRLDD